MKKFEKVNDTGELRALLNSITKELDLNFLEKRGRNKSHKTNPIDELNDAIIELNNREKDLQAAVGIALMLLDNIEILEKRVFKNKNKVLQANERSHHLTIENNSIKESLISSELKNEELNKALIETEEAMLVNSQELNRIMREKILPCSEIASDLEIDEIKREFNQQIETINTQKNQLEKENKLSKDIIKSLEKELNTMKDKFKIIQEKLQETESKLKESEKKFIELDIRLEDTQNELALISSKFQRLKLYTERLEEEISINENKKPPESFHFHHQSSLHSELSVLENLEDSLHSSFHYDESLDDVYNIKQINNYHCINPSTRYTSIQSYSKLFTIKTSNHIKIYPSKSSRKQPSEEYFMLTTQIIKMNSPHMENICSVNTQLLYEKALHDEIPFHKWHEWIEKQLNNAYIQTLYKKKKNNVWLKTAVKKQLVSPS